MPADPEPLRYWDVVVPPVVLAAIVSLATAFWQNVRRNARDDQREMERAKEAARIDARISAIENAAKELTETSTLLRGVLIGYDGKNGFKGRTEEDIVRLRHNANTQAQTVSNLTMAFRLMAQRISMTGVAELLETTWNKPPPEGTE